MKTKYLRCKTCGGYLYNDPAALPEKWFHSGTPVFEHKAIPIEPEYNFMVVFRRGDPLTDEVSGFYRFETEVEARQFYEVRIPRDGTEAYLVQILAGPKYDERGMETEPARKKPERPEIDIEQLKKEIASHRDPEGRATQSEAYANLRLEKKYNKPFTELRSMALEDDLRKLRGLPPYDGPENIVRGDGYFQTSIEKRYGASIAELEKHVKLG